MERERLIRILEQGFSSVWLSYAKPLEYKTIKQIEESFLIDKMVETINRSIENTNGRLSTARHEEVRLKILARKFAMILYIVSDEGSEVNLKTIQEAQKILKLNGKCKVYPCTKLFD